VGKPQGAHPDNLIAHTYAETAEDAIIARARDKAWLGHTVAGRHFLDHLCLWVGREDEIKDHLPGIDHLLRMGVYLEAIPDLVVAGGNDPGPALAI
jgi:hypothetical protein